MRDYQKRLPFFILQSLKTFDQIGETPEIDPRLRLVKYAELHILSGEDRSDLDPLALSSGKAVVHHSVNIFFR